MATGLKGLILQGIRSLRHSLLLSTKHLKNGPRQTFVPGPKKTYIDLEEKSAEHRLVQFRAAIIGFYGTARIE